jgi:hypothetical protein
VIEAGFVNPRLRLMPFCTYTISSVVIYERDTGYAVTLICLT